MGGLQELLDVPVVITEAAAHVACLYAPPRPKRVAGLPLRP